MLKLGFVIFHIAIIQVNSRSSSGTESLQFSYLRTDSEISDRNCSKCPLGWGARKLCTAQVPTKCERCVTGNTYSDARRCLPCSKCGVGLYEARKCSPVRDTVCDDCTSVMYKPQVKKNRDFRIKCGYLFLKRPGKLLHGKPQMSHELNSA